MLFFKFQIKSSFEFRDFELLVELRSNLVFLNLSKGRDVLHAILLIVGHNKTFVHRPIIKAFGFNSF